MTQLSFYAIFADCVNYRRCIDDNYQRGIPAQKIARGFPIKPINVPKRLL
ncbi:MAG: hypothetical protein ACRCUY_03260 [Thermoguttaceae bacterium]